MRRVWTALVVAALMTPAAMAAEPYFAGMFAQGCDSVNRCVDEAMALSRDVCAKLGYRRVVTPTRPEEVLVVMGGGAQGTFTWQAPVNCSNAG